MIKKDIIYFGGACILFCDEKCNKAWGLNNRESVQLSDDEDDIEWLADDELREAPEDPGTYEGDHAKPRCDEDKLNKWCCRECERSKMVSKNEINDETDFEALLNDFSVRIKNIGD
jgi:hypothetical protein